MAQNSCLNGWKKSSPHVQPCCLPHACFPCIIFGSLPLGEPSAVMDPPRNRRPSVFPSSTRRLNCMVMSAAKASLQVEARHPTGDIFSQSTALYPPNDRINQSLLRLVAYTKPFAPALPTCQPRVTRTQLASKAFRLSPSVSPSPAHTTSAQPCMKEITFALSPMQTIPAPWELPSPSLSSTPFAPLMALVGWVPINSDRNTFHVTSLPPLPTVSSSPSYYNRLWAIKRQSKQG